MSVPTDNKLYNRTKKQVYKKYPKHSAYRSGILVKTYKAKFKSKYGNRKKSYKGKRTRKKGLSRCSQRNGLIRGVKLDTNIKAISIDPLIGLQRRHQ